MKTLILARHAKTEQIGFMSSKSDFERELLPRGYSDSILVAESMKSKRIKPNLLITSKACRAEQTTERFANNLGIEPSNIVHEQFLYDGYTTSQLIDYLAQYDDHHETIMIIGHNPEIAMMAINFTDSDYLHFPTTGTISISFNTDKWSEINAREGKIEWFVSPKMLK
ncbi:histidine phosphatase family protein [Carboxylicivirga sp. M1479]|uniref:SixA phosphatase family protein n=1 Tax=Carboxylicivirga sp. M1479 TaxID=2594476 RepID=UPI00117879D8|nr:histidine phosphatase family protein [Carboxylicivirga sp. M1479]TRX70910.1 phosphoglycerate mutase [Carboxylicivirga sp. M1479]